MATHSSILAWRIPGTEEPGRLQSMRSQGRTRLQQLTIHAWIALADLRQHDFLLHVLYLSSL